MRRTPKSGVTQKRPDRRRSDTSLVLSNLALDDDAVLKLVDEWIVPALVEQFLDEQRRLAEGTQSEDKQSL